VPPKIGRVESQYVRDLMAAHGGHVPRIMRLLAANTVLADDSTPRFMDRRCVVQQGANLFQRL
jgi:hypothetical protein